MSTEVVQFDQMKADIAMFLQPLDGLRVVDATSNAAAAGALKTVKTLQKQIEERRTAIVGPFNDKVKACNALAKEVAKPLDEAEVMIKNQIAEFALLEAKRREEELRKAREEREALERKAAEERKRIEDDRRAQDQVEANRIADEKAARDREEGERVAKQKRESAALSAFGLSADPKATVRAPAEVVDLDAQRRESEAKRKREAEQIATNARLDREAKEREAEAQRKERAILASRPKNTREVWKFEITDPTTVPACFRVIDEALIREAVRTGAREIPGVRIFAAQEVVSR